MSHPERYPPPPYTFQAFQQQQQPGESGFPPGMWSWQETLDEEPSWGYSMGFSNSYEESASYGPQETWGDYDINASYGNYGQHWHHGGRPYRQKRRRHWIKKKEKLLHICDACARGFNNTESYNEHMSQHVKCSFPDCNYTAHEKIVKAHFKFIHAPEKQIKLDTSEEIAKWREERRKNYPKRENVEKKVKTTEMSEETGPDAQTPCSSEPCGTSESQTSQQSPEMSER